MLIEEVLKLKPRNINKAGFVDVLIMSLVTGFISGIAVTIFIQSSSATDVMVIGFVSSGLMSLFQAIGVIMGANIGTEGKLAIIPGGRTLQGAPVIATDLRAGAAVVLTGLVAEGKTEVSQIYHIDRGYEHFVDKLKALGADIERIED